MYSGTARAQELNRGVYYARRDYAGLLRRFLILLIDAVVVGAIFLVALVSPVILGANEQLGVHLVVVAFVGVSFLYLVILGRTRVGTLGYLLTGVRIVDLRGNPPSVLQMTGRALFSIFGWPSIVLILLWSGGETDRQALHDKLAHTYVIKRGALPMGHGEERYMIYDINGSMWVFCEIRRHVT